MPTVGRRAGRRDFAETLDARRDHVILVDMELQLRSAVLRPFRPGDEESLARHADNWNIAKNMRDAFPHPYGLEEARRWIAFTATQPSGATFAIEVGGEVAGGIGLVLMTDIYRQMAEVGYWLGERFWRRGLATEALTAMTAHAFSHFELVRVFAGVFEDNVASARVLERAGYTFEGRLRKSVTKRGRILDQLLYARVAAD